MSMLADHIAALVLELASRNQGSFSYFSDELSTKIADNFRIKITESLAVEASKRLVGSGAATSLRSPLTSDLYQVTPSRLTFYYQPENAPDAQTSVSYDASWTKAQEEYSILKAYYVGGDMWVDRVVRVLSQHDLVAVEAEQNFQEESIFAPASDRIVSLKDNQEKVAEAIEAVESIQELIRADNSPRIPNSADRPRFIEQLSSAIRLLKLDRLSIKALSGLILPVLTYLSLKFADEAIGEASSALLKLLSDWLGIVF